MSERLKNIQQEDQLALDDGRRVKVLSPGMMVFKRFIRNRLAIAGICILIFMFAFSFIGGVVSPYRQDQVFYKVDSANKEYASAVMNTDYRFTAADGGSLSTMLRATFNSQVKATGKDEATFTADGVTYLARKLAENFYVITAGKNAASVAALGKITDIRPAEGEEISDALRAAITSALASGNLSFEVDGVSYTLVRGKAKSYDLSKMSEVAIASMLNFDAFSKEYTALASSFAFRKACETALHAGETRFSVDGAEYRLDIDSETQAQVFNADGAEVASVSNMIVNPVTNGVFLSAAYKDAVMDAIAEKQKSFDFVNEAGETEQHTIQMRGNNYIISTVQQTYLIDMYATPTAEHPLGTDDHGMDVLTRLMYGGRISLMVGFVVVFLETFLGIIMGGLAGYYGKWVDNLIMRLVDIFYCLPSMPIMIILGAMMDALRMNTYVRLMIMMAALGLMGWAGVARLVRGQILSLREQEFMVATEATGIKVKSRIFRHLVPNVMPQLIVTATMGMGSVIITESTLSFLGLGVKHPLATWGTIINSVSSASAMAHYAFIWIPVGLLICLTVIAFNFVGDGLRDAYDPKSKR